MIVFQNPGVIDVRCITTFGVNAKDDSRNPIGRFGTGLKYAIAVLIREGHKIIIHAGTTTYTFAKRETEIRGKTFQMIHMTSRRPAGPEEIAMNATAPDYTEGVDLPFTTELGKNWKMWQAYRELYCNCVTDEGGAVEQLAIDTPMGWSPDHTVVIVCGRDFEAQHEQRDSFILDPDRELLFKVPGVIEVYRGSSIFAFYRGIRVGDVEPARYTYNVLSHMYLTEDRTLLIASQFTDAIAIAAASGLNLEFTEDVITIVNDDGSDRAGLERQLDFSTKTLSESVFALVKRVIEDTKRKVNTSMVSTFRDYERENLLSRRVDLSADEAKQLAEALADCYRVGLPWGGKTGVVADLGAGVDTVGRDDTILLAIDLFTVSDNLRNKLAREIARLTFKVHGEDLIMELIRHLFKNAVSVKPAVAELHGDSIPAAPFVEPENVYVLIGTWSRNDKVVHREIVDPSRVEDLRALHYIEYNDGTTLSLSLVDTPRADTIGMTKILGYDSLIRQAVSEARGVNYVRIANLSSTRMPALNLAPTTTDREA